MKRAYAIPGYIHTVEDAVSDVWEVPVDRITERTRKREIVEARQVCMWWRSNHTKESYSRIGERLGGYDHATIIHARKTVLNLRQNCRIYRSKIDLVLEKMDRKMNADESHPEI